jgi:thioester reductase-like protein
MQIIKLVNLLPHGQSKSLYVTAPDSFTDNKIKEDLETIKEQYQKDITNFKALNPEPPAFFSRIIDRFDDNCTMAEAKEIISKQIKEYNEWHRQYDKFTRSLESRLREFEYLILDWSPIKSVSICWDEYIYITN